MANITQNDTPNNLPNNVKVGLEKFYHQIIGPESAPKLVFLHGVMGFSANWRRIAKAFTDEFRILLYDQRGHGKSYHAASGYAPADYAADLEEILQILGWQEINLVGHSMGGRVAYHFAHLHPKRVTRLVIEDIGPSMHPTNANLVLRVLDAVPTPFSSRAAAKTWFETEFVTRFADQSNVHSLAGFLFANLVESDHGDVDWRFSVEGVRESVTAGRAEEHWQILRQLSMPTLLVRGEYSDELSRSTFKKILEQNPVIQGIEIKGSGHWVHTDQPDLFISALRQFLLSPLSHSDPA